MSEELKVAVERRNAGAVLYTRGYINILIEIIEKMMDRGGKIGFCCLTPVIHKTFQIMGLANYASIFESEDVAVKEMKIAG